jgi:hypothetical protein
MNCLPKEFLIAEWKYLALLNYEIALSVLTPCLPAVGQEPIFAQINDLP